MDIIRTANDLTEHTVATLSLYPSHQETVRAMIGLACWLYGREGTDWAMVADNTVIGCHVRTPDGETLHIA